MNRSLVILNATVVDCDQMKQTDLVIEDGKIVEVGPSDPGLAAARLDATGLFAFPGFVDAHVHFNEPGRSEWEGLETGSRALALGGGTTFVDMPLNSDPPVLYADALTAKRRLAEKKSVADFALWGGLCPGFEDEIPRMAAAGAAGFKAFLCPSGINEFPAADAATLRRGMQLARECNLPISVHAEDPAMLDASAPRDGDTSLRAFFRSRPKASEVSAVALACELAGETGAALYVVHVTCREALDVIAQAKAAGVDVTAETCPHYLLFDEDTAVGIGAPAKCAPPLRSSADVAALWEDVLAGRVDTIGSDHSPAPPAMKEGTDFFKIWGGISGCQHGVPALLGELQHRAPDRLRDAAGWLASRPANRLHLGGKGRLMRGFDGDVTLVSFGQPVAAQPAVYRHPRHAYENLRMRCVVHHVVRRGEFLVRDGALNPRATAGRFLRPEAA